MSNRPGYSAAERPSRYLSTVFEGSLAITLVTTTLIYTRLFNDHFLAKSGVVLGLGSLTAAIGLARAVLTAKLPVPGHLLAYAGGLFLLASAISLSLAQNSGRGIEVLFLQAVMFVLCLTSAAHCECPRATRRLTVLVVGLGLVVAVLGLLQFNDIQLVPLPRAYDGTPLSTLGNPNFVAHYLELAIPFAAATLILGPWRLATRAAVAVSLVAMSAHMVLIESRAGWMSAAIALMLLGAGWLRTSTNVPSRRRCLVGASITAGAVAVMLAVALLPHRVELPSALDRVAANWNRLLASTDEADFSRSMRMLIWSDTRRLIAQHPYVGVGPGNYEFFLPAARSVSGHRAWRELMDTLPHVPYYAHNEYLEIWAEVGPLGLVGWLAVMILLFLLGWKTVFSKTTRSLDNDFGIAHSAACGSLCAIAAALIHAVFSFNFQDAVASVHFWLFAGMLLAMGDGLRNLRLASFTAKAVTAGVALTILCVGSYLGLCLLVGDYYYSRGWQHYTASRPNRAILEFRKAVDWRDHDFRHTHALGQVALLQGRLREAEVALRLSLDSHPNNARALRLLGEALLQGGKGREASGPLGRAVKLDPLNVQGYSLRALAERKVGDVQGAVRSRRQALSFRPEDPILMMSLGTELLNAGNASEGVRVLERAALLQPNNAMIAGNLGAALLKTGHLPEAETALRLAIDNDPSNRSQWQYNLAQVLVRTDRRDEAKTVLRQAALNFPDDTRIASMLARLGIVE